MYAIKGVYDGSCFKLEQPIPVKEEYDVVITFTDPIKKTQENILSYFNCWNDADSEVMHEIIDERSNFADGREDL